MKGKKEILQISKSQTKDFKRS